MARIPEAEIERLKREVSLVRLIESQGHKLVKRGKDAVMRCVFYEDATASLVLTESKNLYHCFGCNAAGSVIDWVMKTQSVSLPHAVQLLKNGAPLDGERVGVNRSVKRHLPSLVAPEAGERADAQFNPQAELRQVVAAVLISKLNGENFRSVLTLRCCASGYSYRTGSRSDRRPVLRSGCEHRGQD